MLWTTRIKGMQVSASMNWITRSLAKDPRSLICSSKCKANRSSLTNREMTTSNRSFARQIYLSHHKTIPLVRPSEVMTSKTIYYLNFLTLLGEPQLIRCSVCQTKLIRDRMRCLTCFKEKVSNRPVIDMVSESPTPVCPIVDLRMVIPSSQRYKLWEAVAFKCHSEGFTLAKRKNPKPTPSTCLDREDFTCTMQKWS